MNKDSAPAEPGGPGGEALRSIGELAEETGLSPDTIRVWERRYGRPVPIRLPSGHRRYTQATVSWLRRVAEALSLGHRPAKVVRMPDDELDALLVLRDPVDDQTTSAIIGLVATGDREALYRALTAERAARAPLAFIEEVAVPLARAVGREWVDGRLDVRHEHLFSEALEAELRRVRESLPEGDGPVILLTTLAGERHSIAIHMAAVAAKLAGARPAVIGCDTPDEQIAQAAREHGAAYVALSVSLATGGVETDRRLARLRVLLDDGVALIVGGAGARGVRRGPRGIEYLSSFGELAARLSAD